MTIDKIVDEFERKFAKATRPDTENTRNIMGIKMVGSVDKHGRPVLYDAEEITTWLKSMLGEEYKI